MSTDLTVTRNDEAGRYEARVGADLVTVIDFVPHGSTMTITHTVTDPHWQGKGMAGRATEAMLQDLRSLGQQVDPICPYTVSFMASHPEFEDLR